jgi:hypothetical protein
MSFTDGKRRVATEHNCVTRWGGESKGRRFRCYLCGHRFQPGDGWRWQYAAGQNVTEDGRKFGVTNFLVCDACDGPDVLDRWVKRNAEFLSDRFWALR